MHDARDTGATRAEQAAKPPTFTLPPMIPLPSIDDLMRRIRVLEDTFESPPDRSDIAQHRAADWASDQQDALQDLIATMPAATLADAAAQLHVAIEVVQRAQDYDDDMSAAERRAALTKLRRMLRSSFFVVADAAGIKPESITGSLVPDSYALDFPELATRPCGGRTEA